MKEITDRLEKSENRLNALEQTAQVNARLPSLVNSQGGKRRAVDSSIGDGAHHRRECWRRIVSGGCPPSAHPWVPGS
eukprot:7924955-Pyramimonas_sp.AAC.1